MSSALSDHWRLSFVGTDTCASAREDFCDGHVTRISPSLFSRPSCNDVTGAVRKGSWSAPGPDGVPSAVWSRSSSCVSLDFFKAIVFLGEGGLVPVGLNSALAAYIPKKGLVLATTDYKLDLQKRDHSCSKTRRLRFSGGYWLGA